MGEKKLKCPKCEKSWIAEIFWGYPSNIESFEDELEKKEIVLGGCLITDSDPRWECNNCHHRWGDAEHNESDHTSSSDYEQEFDLNEVHD